MTELAARALISRSGMTRRVARLVDEGLVRRTSADAEPAASSSRSRRRAWRASPRPLPVQRAGSSKLFVEQLDDEELAVLEGALDKVSLDCSFG